MDGKVEIMPAPVYMRRTTSSEGPEYYPTPPYVTYALMQFIGETLDMTCIEPAAGGGHMADVLRDHFKSVDESDVYDYCGRGFKIADFLEMDPPKEKYDWLITNPPFNISLAFAQRAPLFAHNYAFFQRITWLESQRRYVGLFRHNPPNIVAPFVNRVNLIQNRLAGPSDTGSPVCYAWFIWNGDSRSTRVVWITKDLWDGTHPTGRRVER